MACVFAAVSVYAAKEAHDRHMCIYISMMDQKSAGRRTREPRQGSSKYVSVQFRPRGDLCRAYSLSTVDDAHDISHRELSGLLQEHTASCRIYYRYLQAWTGTGEFMPRAAFCDQCSFNKAEKPWGEATHH
jgi:hypothetical protein